MPPLSAENAKRFLFAGNAKLTIVNTATGSRFTYKVQTPQRPDPSRPVRFVKLLNGPDNYTNYAYLGTIFGEGAQAQFRLTSKSCAGPDAPSAINFRFVFEELLRDDLSSSYQVWHEGACGRCGKLLTVPESIACGLGPDCLAIMGGTPLPPAPSEPEPSQVETLVDAVVALLAGAGGRVDGDDRPVIVSLVSHALERGSEAPDAQA